MKEKQGRKKEREREIERERELTLLYVPELSVPNLSSPS